MKETLYHACEAKFMAETASDVGTETQMFIARHGFNTMSHQGKLIEEIRDQWEKHGKPAMPSDVIKKIKEAEITFSNSDF
jgi:peroxiredoxin family protein